MQILVLLGMYFDAAVLFVTCNSLLFSVHNHVKLVVSPRILYCVAMGLADLLGIADLHCRKVESNKWLKHKLRASI